MSTPEPPGGPLLAADEPGPVERVNPDGPSPLVLVCDHASNRVPRALADLGLDPAALTGHIAWDPGAAEVARGLAARLGAPLLLGTYSRLVVDLNRPLESPELIPSHSDGVSIPGNLHLDQRGRAARLDALFHPYHAAIADLLDGRGERPTLLLAVHSFTPNLAGHTRPWHAGVACGPDHRLAGALYRALTPSPELHIGYNQPYDVDPAHDYTLPRHGEARGIPHAMIELRNDGLATPAGIAAWTERLAAVLSTLALMP